MSEKDEDKKELQPTVPNQFQPLLESIQEFVVQKKERDEAHQNRLRDNRQNRLNNQSVMIAYLKKCMDLDTWLLYSEALAVCQNRELVNDIQSEFTQTGWALNVQKHIEAAKYTSLPVLNPKDKPAQWRVKPVEFINWLYNQNQPPIPPVNDALQHLIKSPPKATVADKSSNGYTERHARNREAVLTAALAVLAAYPDQCRVKGKISATAIVRQIEEKAQLWFGHEDIPLASRTMTELINKAIKTTLTE